MDCPFCVEKIQEGDDVIEVLTGEAIAREDGGFEGEVKPCGGYAETSHRECYEKALQFFQKHEAETE